MRRTLGCAYDVASQLETPGIVQRTQAHEHSWFGIGSLDPSTVGREEEVAELLRHVGRVDIVPDILSAKWMKLITNAMSLAAGSMLGLSDDMAAVEVPGMRALMLRLGAEDVADPATLHEVLWETLRASNTPGLLSTLTMDHLKGRKTEAASINGLVAQELERLGKTGTANAAVLEITERITQGALERTITNLDLVQEMLPPTGV